MIDIDKVNYFRSLKNKDELLSICTSSEEETMSLVAGRIGRTKFVPYSLADSETGKHGKKIKSDDLLTAIDRGEWIDFNSKRFTNFIIIDLDVHEGQPTFLETGEIPFVEGLAPAFARFTPSGGVHLAYVIDTLSTYRADGTLNERGISFLDEVITKLYAAFGSDFCYTNRDARNPFRDDGRTFWFTGTRVHSLEDFKKALINLGRWDIKVNKKSTRKYTSAVPLREIASGEQPALFSRLCLEFARKLDTMTIEDVEAKAIEMNAEFPNPIAESRALETAKYVYTYGAKNRLRMMGKGGFYSVEQASRGGRKNSVSQQVNRHNSIRKLNHAKQHQAVEGWEIARAALERGASQKEAAALAGVSTRTIRRWQEKQPTVSDLALLPVPEETPHELSSIKVKVSAPLKDEYLPKANPKERTVTINGVEIPVLWSAMSENEMFNTTGIPASWQARSNANKTYQRAVVKAMNSSKGDMIPAKTVAVLLGSFTTKGTIDIAEYSAAPIEEVLRSMAGSRYGIPACLRKLADAFGVCLESADATLSVEEFAVAVCGNVIADEFYEFGDDEFDTKAYDEIQKDAMLV